MTSINGDYVELLDEEKATLVAIPDEVSVELQDVVWFVPGPTGSAGVVWTGTWNAATAYLERDGVFYNGASYRRLVAGTTAGAPDVDTTNWALIAAQGTIPDRLGATPKIVTNWNLATENGFYFGQAAINGPLPGVDEVQTVTINGAPTGGTFTLTYDAQTTAAIAFNATAAAVQTALEALSTIGAGNATVTGAAGGPYTVTFVNALGQRDLAQQLTAVSSLTGGTTPSVTVATTTEGVSPESLIGLVEVQDGSLRTQTVAKFLSTAAGGSQRWRRSSDSAGAWGVWDRLWETQTDLDVRYVNATGDETVAGIKTFSSAPVVPDAAFAIIKTNGLQAALDAKVDDTERGAANGIATLGADSKVPAIQLPSYVDDVLEFANLAGFPATGETSKIYVALDNGKTYRWSGTAYIEISPSEVNSVAGKTGVVTLVPADAGAHPAGGLVTDSMLPPRLRTGDQASTDANLFVENGWWRITSTTANRPPFDWGVAETLNFGAGSGIIQRAQENSTLAGTPNKWERTRHAVSGVWTSWYQLRTAEAELDTRYKNVGELVADTELPTRLRATVGSYGVPSGDWNAAISSGWYTGLDAANAPGVGWWMVEVVAHASNYATQTATPFAGGGIPSATDSKMWRRDLNNGVWTAWNRIRWHEGELDARYAPISISTDSGWIAPALLNLWVAYGVGDEVYYRKIGNRVTIRGLVKNGTTTAQTSIFTLPAGYRPLRNLRLIVEAGGSAGGMEIIAGNGNVNFVRGVNTYFQVDCSFLVD